MAERKTKSLALPSGGTAEIKEYITAGEFIDITESKDAAEVPKTELAKRLILAALESLNGSKDDIATRLRDLPLHDYVVLNKEIAKLTSGDFTATKNL